VYRLEKEASGGLSDDLSEVRERAEEERVVLEGSLETLSVKGGAFLLRLFHEGAV